MIFAATCETRLFLVVGYFDAVVSEAPNPGAFTVVEAESSYHGTSGQDFNDNTFRLQLDPLLDHAPETLTVASAGAVTLGDDLVIEAPQTIAVTITPANTPVVTILSATELKFTFDAPCNQDAFTGESFHLVTGLTPSSAAAVSWDDDHTAIAENESWNTALATGWEMILDSEPFYFFNTYIGGTSGPL